jgi:hypothetical protein
MVNVLPISLLMQRETGVSLRGTKKTFKGVRLLNSVFSELNIEELKTHLNPHKRLERFLFLQKQIILFHKGRRFIYQKVG